MQHQVQFEFNITLIQDGKPNAYLYAEEDLKSGAIFFGNWICTLGRIKKAYPKNKCIKHLLSSPLTARKTFAKK